MTFSEKMRESLGAEGVRLEVELSEASNPIPRGETRTARVTVAGGTRPARIEALVIRVVEADRHWRTREGTRVSEDDAQALEDRRHLTAAWDRHVAAESRRPLELDVDAHTRHELEIEVAVPPECQTTSIHRSHTLNVQADIKGQIDPTGNVRILVT